MMSIKNPHFFAAGIIDVSYTKFDHETANFLQYLARYEAYLCKNLAIWPYVSKCTGNHYITP